MNLHPGIRIDKISPSEGIPGFLFVAATAAICLTIPAIRVFLLASLALGLVGAVILSYLRR